MPALGLTRALDRALFAFGGIEPYLIDVPLGLNKAHLLAVLRMEPHISECDLVIIAVLFGMHFDDECNTIMKTLLFFKGSFFSKESC